MTSLSRRAIHGLIFCAASISAASPSAALAQASVPPSAAPAAPALSLDSAARAMVAAINAADPSARARFVSNTLSARALAQDGPALETLLNRLHEQGGAMEIVKTESSGRGMMVTLRSASRQRHALIYISPDRADPAKLGLVDYLKAWDPAADRIEWPSAPPAGDAELAALVDRNVARLTEMGAFSGVVLVARGDRVVLERGYGWANLEDSVRNTPASRFAIASIGKMFTAAAIGQLVEAGKLRLDDTLAKVLPEYPNADRARRITIRHLLGHTAGLGMMFDDKRFDPARDYASALERAATVADGPLAFEPGTRWQYSNEGYEVLAAVIEKVSGERYDDYLRRRVWGPAGMAATGNFGADDVVPRRAVGYRPRADDPLRIGTPHANWTFIHRGSGAGGAYTTAGDLLRFSRALRAGKIVSAAMRDTLWTGRSPLPWDAAQKYGYGAIVSTVSGRTVVGHGGGGGGSGMDNEFRFATDGSFTVIVLSNIDPPAASDLSAALVKLMAAQQETRTGG